MIQNPARLALDLDVVADILPMEDGRLLLDLDLLTRRTRYLLFSCRRRNTRLFIADPLTRYLVHSLPEKDQHFAFRVLRSDILGSPKVKSHKEHSPGDDDAKVPPSVAVDEAK